MTVPFTDNLGLGPEAGQLLPYPVDPQVSYVGGAFRNWFETELDPGIVVHRPLPQYAYDADVLGSADVYDRKFTSNDGGVNINSNGTFVDTVQRMANSVYRICMKGWCIRVAYQPVFPIF